MYSPSIDPGLIPVLYHTARQRKMPMTRLVDGFIFDCLCRCPDLPSAAHEALAEYKASVTNLNINKGEANAQSLHVVLEEGSRE